MIKLIASAFIILFAISCNTNFFIHTTIKNKNMIPIDSTFEKIDTAIYWNRNNNPEWNEEKEMFTKQDVRIIYLTANSNDEFEEIDYPPMPAFYYVYKKYYPSGNIKDKSIYIGGMSREGAVGGGVVIEMSYHFDQHGNIIKTINENEKFGKFSYNKLFTFLENEGVINLHTGKNRNALKIFFNEQEKAWTVEVYTNITELTTNSGEKELSRKEGFGYKIGSDSGSIYYKRKQIYIPNYDPDGGKTEYKYLIKNGKPVM